MINIFIIELIVIFCIMAIATYLGYKYAEKKQKSLPTFALAVVGVIFICCKSIALWIPIYLYLPRIFGMYMDILQACGGILIGIAYLLMKDVARQRILFSVFVFIFAFYMSFHKLAFILQPIDYSRLETEIREGVVMQTTSFTCLPSSVATILRSLGIEAEEGELASLARTTTQGTDSYRMIYAIEQVGKKQNLSAYLQRLTLLELDALSQPCVLTVYFTTATRDIPHAVVFFGKKDKSYIIGDPLNGRSEISRKALIKGYKWEGETLQIKK